MPDTNRLHNLESSHYTLDEAYPISFKTLTADSISVLLKAINIEPEYIEIYVSISADIWPQIIANGAFHIDLEPNDLGGDDSEPIEAVLVLRQPLTQRITDAQSLIDGLLSDNVTLLHQTEAWLLASALQAVAVPGEPGAKASIGFRTRWASPFT